MLLHETQFQYSKSERLYVESEAMYIIEPMSGKYFTGEYQENCALYIH